MNTRIVATGLGLLVCLLIAGAALPLVFERTERRVEANVSEIQRLESGSHELRLASLRVLAAVPEERKTARAAWSEVLARADRTAASVFAEEGMKRLTVNHRSNLKQLWVQRRAAAIGTIEMIDRLNAQGIHLTESGGSSARLNSGRRLQTRRASEDTAIANLQQELANAEAALVKQREAYQQVEYWSSVACAAGILAAALALPFYVRQLRTRVRADERAREIAERAARASEHDLLITLHSIGDAVIAMDTEGRIRRLNEVAEHLTGWRQDDAVGRAASDILKFVDTATGSELRDSVMDVMRTGAPIVRSSGLDLVRADGTRRHVSENAAPIRDTEGTVRGAVIVLHDMTIQRALEARLRDVQRMESIGRLAGGVAHEFNNLLQIISGNSALLRGHFPSRGETQDYFARIDEAVKRAAKLTDQLLAFGGRQTLVLKSTDLAGVVGRGIEVARRLLPDAISIDYAKPPVPAVAQVDSAQMEQVVVNLCLHARKSMPEGGRLRVILDEIEIGAPSAEDAVPARIGPYVRIRISDTSRGMSDETRQRIFEPFFSTSGSVLDAGLGLAAVHGIVQQHGGFVEVDSATGRGTTFTVLIPGRSVAQKSTVRSSTHTRVPSMRGKVLIAEDEPGVRLMAERILKRQGFEPIGVADGAEACRQFEANADDICVVLLDVVMPEMGGVEAARIIREAKPDVPIIFCTGYSETVHTEHQPPKPWKVLQKPYGVQELIDTIDHCLSNAGMPTPN